ncbi:MAG: molybdenum hydroxylase, partial [Oscillospiraceae bacterium]|nr:molybdenum hydroxylase [Oscillospiraceae bacterium]MDY5735269.1 molybdenum hydroxylase [Oscillospiraceae bacterium]
MLALIRGAGDLASGIALRLYRSGIGIVMTDLERPMSIRRTVAFSDAILRGTMTVEDVTAKFAENAQQAREFLAQGTIPVLADPECRCREELKPDVLV